MTRSLGPARRRPARLAGLELLETLRCRGLVLVGVTSAAEGELPRQAKAEPLPNSKHSTHADILLSGITTVDNPVGHELDCAMVKSTGRTVRTQDGLPVTAHA